MGKQLNFYLQTEDFSEINAFLKEQNYVLDDCFSARKDLAFLSSVNEKGLQISWKKYITKAEFADKIQSRFLDSRQLYKINELYSPVIELLLSTENPEKKELSRGRLFYQTGYYDKAGIWQEKEPEFIQSAEKLFRWFRKNFAKSETAYGNYTSPAVLEFVRQGGILKLN